HRGGQRGLPQGRGRWPARGATPVLRRSARLDRRDRFVLLVHVRQRADDGERGARQGLRLVRQRVGIFMPARRSRREDGSAARALAGDHVVRTKEGANGGTTGSPVLNEWGYSCRLVDLVEKMARQLAPTPVA